MYDCRDSLTAVLFPHPHASEREIRRILSFFDHLVICRPWYMEDDFSVPPEVGLEIVRPPERLRPVQGFPSLISEYKNWMRQHSDKGHAYALSALRKDPVGEDSTWDIRRDIRGAGWGDRTRDSATRYHLLLHLACEGEESLREAGEVLSALKEQGSPLRDAVMEEEPKGPLDDLSGFDPDRLVEGEFMEMIFESWEGLFGGSLQRDAVFVTLSPSVFENFTMRSGGDARGVHRFSWPDLSGSTEEPLFAGGELLAREHLREYRDAVMRALTHPAGDMKGSADLIRELQSDPAWSGKKMLSFAAGRGSLRGLSAETIFLLKGPCRG